MDSYFRSQNVLCPPNFSRAVPKQSFWRSASAFASPPLRRVCCAAASAAVCGVISVTSLAKQKLSPYKYGNLMIELSISWDKFKALC